MEMYVHVKMGGPSKYCTQPGMMLDKLLGFVHACLHCRPGYTDVTRPPPSGRTYFMLVLCEGGHRYSRCIGRLTIMFVVHVYRLANI